MSVWVCLKQGPENMVLMVVLLIEANNLTAFVLLYTIHYTLYDI